MLHGSRQQFDAENLRLRHSFGDARAEFAGACADIEHPRIARQPVEIDQ